MNTLRNLMNGAMLGAVLLTASAAADAALSQDQKLAPVDFTTNTPLNIPDARYGQAVAVHGNWMAVGRPGDKNTAGAVDIYERVAAAWVFRVSVSPPGGGQTGAEFGAAVDMYVNAGLVTLVVGSPAYSGAFSGQGRAYYFNDSDSSSTIYFGTVVVKDAPSPEANGRFGHAVAVYGDIGVIAEPNDGGTNAGAVFLHFRNVSGLNAWGQLSAGKTGNPGSGFGTSVDLHGEYLIVGAPYDSNSAGLRSGLAYVYRQDLGGTEAFGLKHTLTPNYTEAEMAFGFSVGIWDSDIAAANSASRSIVGAPLQNSGGFADIGFAGIFNDDSNVLGYGGTAGIADGQAGYSVAIDGDEAIVGMPGRTVSGKVNAGLVTFLSRSAGFWATSIQFGQTDSGAGNDFGRSVAVSGLLAVAGAPGSRDDVSIAPPGAVRAGAAMTLSKSGGLWSSESRLGAVYRQPNTDTDQFFGASVAVDGAWMAVGVRQDRQKSVNAGAVQMYRKVAGVWTAHSKLTALYGDGVLTFGQSLALSGTRLVVGAPMAPSFPGGAVSSGAVYVYEFNGSAWVQTVARTSPGGIANSLFGTAVDLYGDVLAVGAPGENGAKGRIYVYRDLVTLTNPVVIDIAGLAANDGAGVTVSVYDPAPGSANDEIVAVGSAARNGTRGSAFILSGASFETTLEIANPDALVGSSFGSSVSLFNGRLAVGAPLPTASGKVYVFSGSGYVTVTTLSSSIGSGQFGASVDLDDSALLVGAPVSNTNKGLGFVYLRSGSSWNEQAPLQPADLSGADRLGSGVALSSGSFTLGASNQNTGRGAAYVYGQAPDVMVAPTAVAVSETGPSTATFNIALNQAPDANVTVALTFDASQVQVNAGSGFGGSPQTLTLTPANATSGVSVSVRAVDDAIVEANPHVLTLVSAATVSTTPRFNGLLVDDVAVSIADNDSTGVFITQSAGTNMVTESGITDSYSIVLGSQPLANVNVAVSFPSAQLTVNGDTDGSYNTIFNATNWNVAQTITLAAVNDRVLEGDHGATLTHTFSSSDAAYDSATAVVDGGPASNDLSVVIGDNETGVLQWASASGSASEGSNLSTAVQLLISANPVGGTPMLAGTVSYTLSTLLGSAEATDIGAISGALSFNNVNSPASNPISVQHSNDTLVEGNEGYALQIALGSAPPGMLLMVAPGSFAGTIVDADTATVSLSGAPTVGEAAGNVPLTVTLNTAVGNTLEGSVSVALNLTDGTASYSAGAGDYAFAGPSASSSLVFAAGSGNAATQIANVQIRDDRRVEGSEAFSASLGTVSGAASVGGAAVSIGINDNDTAAISFLTASSSVSEASTPHTVIALLTINAIGSGTSQLDVALTAVINQTPGSASTPADYALTSSSIQFPVAALTGDSKPIQISIVDDLASEGDETFTLGYGAVTGPASAAGTHTVTIIDNDTPGVSVVESGGNTAVAEGGAGDSYSVVLNSQPTADVSVNLAFPGSQLSLNGNSSGTLALVFTAANWNVARTVSVLAIDDTVVEANPHLSSIVQTISSSDPIYAAINSADVTVSITENDSQQIRFSTTNSTVAETAGTHVVNARLALMTNGVPGGSTSADMVVIVNLTPGTTETADQTLLTTQLTFPAGSAHNALLPINLTIANDPLLEGDESFTLSLTRVSAIGSVIGSHIVTINDDESAVIAYTSANVATSESAGSYSGAVARLTISGSGSGSLALAPENTVGVTVTDTAISAATPADYSRISNSLSFAGGSISPVDQAVAVNIVNDVLIEGGESFTLGLTNATGSGTLSLGGTQLVSIDDNDLALVGFAAGNDSVSEGAGSYSKPVVLTLTGNGAGTPSLQDALTVPLSFVEGSALEPEDFTLAANSLIFVAGSTQGASLNATGTLIDDAVGESNESFDLLLGNALVASNITLGRSVTTFTIIDNDNPGVSVVESGGNTAVAEGGAGDTFSLVLNSQPTADVVIALSATQVTAAPPTLTFSNSNWNVAQTVTLSAIDDAIAETSPHSGSVSFSISSADSNYHGFAVTPLNVDVSDDDTAGITVSESAGNTAVTEGGASDSYSVVLTSEPTANVTVNVGADAQISVSPNSLLFTAANWNQAQTVSVDAVDDNVVEGPNSVAITHTASSTDGNYNAFAVAGVSVAVTDDDSAVVQFAPAAISQSEGLSPMVFTVSLSHPVASGVTLSLSSADGTAKASDYTPIAGATVSFPANSNASQTVNVTIANDLLDEADETFSLTLVNLQASGDVTLGAALAIGTILDDDATPTLSITSPSQPEGNSGSSVMNFVVSLSAISERDVSFSRSTADGSATVTDNDYVAIAPGNLSIAAGQLSLSIPVTINGDTAFEGDESFSVVLTAINNAMPSTLTGTGTVTEDDQQPTTTSITADLPDPSVVGQPYTVNVTVAAQSLSPTGTISISDGTVSCGPVTLAAGTSPNSSGNCSLVSSSVGNKTLTASYTPDSTAFAASSGSASHAVNQATTALSVSGPPRSRINQPTAFSFALSVEAPDAGTPTGTVTLSSGAASCSAILPATSCMLSFDALGSRTVSASYAGDGNFSAAASSGAGNTQTLVYALADMSISKNDNVNTYVAGDLLVYSVVVRNLGPDAAANIVVSDIVPTGLVDVVWTCDASGGVTCPADSGDGNLHLTIASYPVGGLLNFTFFGNVQGTPEQIVNTAVLTLPADTTVDDPQLGNNVAIDADVFDDLFRNGFEDALINSPSNSYLLSTQMLSRSASADAQMVLELDDANGVAVRVYARLHQQTLQLALAQRASNGKLRLGTWKQHEADASLSWTARNAAQGWVLQTAEIR